MGKLFHFLLNDVTFVRNMHLWAEQQRGFNAKKHCYDKQMDIFFKFSLVALVTVV